MPLIFILYIILCLYYMPICNNAIQLNNQQKLQQPIIIMAIVAIIIGGLRNPYMGSGDGGTYKSYFEYYKQIPLINIVQHAFNSWENDESYYILSKIFSLVIPSFQIWMTTLCIIYILPCSIIIYKWSKNPPLSFIYLLLMGNYIFTWNGLKQNIAMSLCLIALIALIENKYKIFALLFVIAFTFHISAIVFLLIFIAIKMPVKSWNLALIALIFLITLFAPAIIKKILSLFFSNISGLNSYIENSKTLNYKNSFVLLFLYMIFYYYKDELIEQSKINKIFLCMSLLGVCLQASATVIAEFFRAAYYFNIINMILISNVSVIGKEKIPKELIQIFLISFIIFIFLWKGSISYKFFWEYWIV